MTDGAAYVEGTQTHLVGGMGIQSVHDGLRAYFRAATKTGSNHDRLNFGGVAFGSQPSSFSVVFQNGHLKYIAFSVQLPEAQKTDGWPTLSDINAELSFIRDELSKQLGCTIGGRLISFPWGAAWSYHDPKGGMASSGVSYEV